MDRMPAAFDRTVPVPGLIDLAKPPFADVGTPKSNAHRRAFWYRRTFRIDGNVPAVAKLKIHKACYGTCGIPERPGSQENISPVSRPFTLDVGRRPPGQWPAEQTGRTASATYRGTQSRGSIPNSWDVEKFPLHSGHLSLVEFILSGTPHIVTFRACRMNQATVESWVTLGGGACGRGSPPVTCFVEAVGGKLDWSAKTPVAIAAGEEKPIELRVPIEPCRLWSPEAPFLYRLEVATSGDTLSTRFGMRRRSRSIRRPSGRCSTGGRITCAARTSVSSGSSKTRPVATGRGSEWVQRLHQVFRGMNWNSARYCIGFPPEQWYDVADELGFLVQDEFPIWYVGENAVPRELRSEELAREYAEWMQERWNHPCVAIWDAQNETITAETGKAIRAVRGLDLSHRPWDNGWSPARAGDTHEVHAYLFMQPGYHRLSDMVHVSPVPKGSVTPNVGHNPLILNEYGMLGLNRDGSCTTTSKGVYESLLGKNSTAPQRRHLCARSLAAETEFWRSHRTCRGVMHFCGLGYSRPDGETSDHFRNVETLTLDPEFESRLRDAFAPVGLMLDFWDDKRAAGKPCDFPVAVVNDLDRDWSG